MSTRIKIHIDPDAILLAHGLNDGGDAQRFFTENVNKRITEYMPYRSGTLVEKARRVTAPNEITIAADYARYQYYGKVWIDPKINASGFVTKDGTWRSHKYVPKIPTDRDLQYDKTMRPKAGPFWDRRMMAEQGDALIADLKDYIKRGCK